MLVPGLHLPVIATDMLIERKTDFVVIIAWRYVGPVIDKNQAFRDRGGKFIVPLPKVEVLQLV